MTENTVMRFDFNGFSSSFSKTPQGFLRVKARLSRTGVFSYDSKTEYRPPDEVFREDSLASLKGAPVTDLHPKCEVLTPQNAKEYIVGLTESVERDGDFLAGSLIIFHEDTIKAIESGERKEISLGYTCTLEPASGQDYDAVQKNIIVNHVALGPKNWGRAGPECAIKTDSSLQAELKALQEKLKILESPEFIEQKVAEKLKLDAVKKHFSYLNLDDKGQSYTGFGEQWNSQPT
jgi:hypothetical protein